MKRPTRCRSQASKRFLDPSQIVRVASSGWALQAGSPTIEARWTTASNLCRLKSASTSPASVMSTLRNAKAGCDRRSSRDSPPNISVSATVTSYPRCRRSRASIEPT